MDVPPELRDYADEHGEDAALIELGRRRGEHLRLVVADYDRRRASRWGRLLLWLLRHTT